MRPKSKLSVYYRLLQGRVDGDVTQTFLYDIYVNRLHSPNTQCTHRKIYATAVYLKLIISLIESLNDFCDIIFCKFSFSYMKVSIYYFLFLFFEKIITELISPSRED